MSTDGDTLFCLNPRPYSTLVFFGTLGLITTYIAHILEILWSFGKDSVMLLQLAGSLVRMGGGEETQREMPPGLLPTIPNPAKTPAPEGSRGHTRQLLEG